MSGIQGNKRDDFISPEQAELYKGRLSPTLSKGIEGKATYGKKITQGLKNVGEMLKIKMGRIVLSIFGFLPAFQDASIKNNKTIGDLLKQKVTDLKEYAARIKDIDSIEFLEKNLGTMRGLLEELKKSGFEYGRGNIKVDKDRKETMSRIESDFTEIEGIIKKKKATKEAMLNIPRKSAPPMSFMPEGADKVTPKVAEPVATPPDVLDDKPVPDDKPVATRKERVLVKEKKRTFNVGVTPEERARLSKKVEERPIYKAKRKGEKALRASEELKNKISYYGEALPAEALGSVESLNKILLSMKIRCIDPANINKLNDLIQDKTLEDLSKNTKLLDEVVGTLDLILDDVEVALLTSGSAKKDDKGAFVEFNNKEIGEAYKAAEICYDKLNDFLAEMLHKEKSLKS